MPSVETGVGRSCAFCGARAAWAHRLAERLVAYREYGEPHTLPATWTLCDRCEAIYTSGDDDAAVEVMRTTAWAWVANEDLAECVRQPLAAFRRADLGARHFDPEPVALARAREQGFVPLRELTGVAEVLGPLWPAEHALWMDELGPASGEEESDEVLDRWLVRSPWASLSLRLTVSALWRWVDQGVGPSPRPLEEDSPLIAEFFTLDEPEVLALAADLEA